MDLIIGAGITGLSYAHYCNNSDYLIFEKDHEIGGYCKTLRRSGYTWDYSGHFFHFKNSDLQKFMFDKIGSPNLLDLKKQTQIRYGNLYIDYPFQKNIHQLDKIEFIECLYDLLLNEQTGYDNFKEMLYVKFGKSIAEKFLIPYNEKLYACDLNKLDKDAMGRFFPYAEKLEIVRNFRVNDNNSYNTRFMYPKGGAIEYIKAISDNIDPDKIILNKKIEKIDRGQKIAYTSDKKRIKYDRLVSTIPLPHLLGICGIEYDQSYYSWNKVLVLNLGFDKKGLDTLNHWVYFPEKKYCFYRVGYYDNILNEPRMSLYVELGFDKNDKIDVSLNLSKVIEDLGKAGIITDHKLLDYQAVIMDPAYVHIKKESVIDVLKMKEILKSDNIFSIGRYGSWTYCSIEDNIVEAKRLIEKDETN